jgi:hypothetical protein
VKGHRQPNTSREDAACQVLDRAIDHAREPGPESLEVVKQRYRTKLLNALRGPQRRRARSRPEGA